MVIYTGNRLIDLFYNIFVVRWLYLVKSTTGHVNEMYKGFDDLSKAIKSAAKSSSQAKDRTGTYDINLKRINK